MTRQNNTDSRIESPSDDTVAIVRSERDAALRVLAGRLAHELRNPLAAVRAACSGLHDDVQEADHKHRLELTLGEVDRVLAVITEAVNSVSFLAEKSVDQDPIPLAMAAINAVRALHPAARIHFSTDTDGPPCKLAREGFRAAIFSVLDHLISSLKDATVGLQLTRESGRLRLQFTPAPENEPVPAMGLLIAERFARDNGGQLTWPGGDDNCLTMELPCQYV